MCLQKVKCTKVAYFITELYKEMIFIEKKGERGKLTTFVQKKKGNEKNRKKNTNAFLI